MKRGAYIGETIELLNVFHHAHPFQKLTAVQTYACSFYGSNLFDLYGPAANQLYRAWQVSVRDAWDVPRQTRTYYVDHIIYLQGLISSINPIISALAYWSVQTVQSVTGRNVANIRREFNVNPLKCKPWTVTVKKREVPEQGHANLELLQNLLEIRAAELEPDILAELNGLIDHVCVQ